MKKLRRASVGIAFRSFGDEMEPRTRFELVTLAFLTWLPRQCSGLR